MGEPRDPSEPPDAKAEALRQRKAKNQRDHRSQPAGMLLYKVRALDVHLEAILEWRQLLPPNQHHSKAEVEAALEKLIASLRAVRVTGDSDDPDFPSP
jgi:hypothetical protein